MCLSLESTCNACLSPGSQCRWDRGDVGLQPPRDSRGQLEPALHQRLQGTAHQCGHAILRGLPWDSVGCTPQKGCWNCLPHHVGGISIPGMRAAFWVGDEGQSLGPNGVRFTPRALAPTTRLLSPYGMRICAFHMVMCRVRLYPPSHTASAPPIRSPGPTSRYCFTPSTDPANTHDPTRALQACFIAPRAAPLYLFPPTGTPLIHHVSYVARFTPISGGLCCSHECAFAHCSGECAFAHSPSPNPPKRANIFFTCSKL